VVDAALADGAEQQPREVVASARSDDQQVGVPRTLDQQARRPLRHDVALDRHLDADLLDQPLDGFFGSPAEALALLLRMTQRLLARRALIDQTSIDSEDSEPGITDQVMTCSGGCS
jgi:hypothetical protein